MNYTLLTLIYCIASEIVCAFLAVLMWHKRKAEFETKSQLFLTLTLGIFCMTFYSLHLAFASCNLCFIFMTCYLVCLDFLVWSVLYFSFVYTKAEKRFLLRLFFVLACIDSFFLILNIFTNANFDLEQRFSPGGYGYWFLKINTPHFFHLIYAYAAVLLSFILLGHSSIVSPSFYKRKYIFILASYFFIIIVKITHITLSLPVDFSVILYGILGTVMLFFAEYSFPDFLISSSISRISETIPSLIFYFDYGGKLEYINSAAKKMFEEQKDLKSFSEQLREKYLLKKKPFFYQTAGSEEHIFAVEYKNLSFHGETVGSYLKLDDKTKEQKQSERLRFLATHDTLTGLFNRHGFFEEVEKALREHVFKSPVMITSNIKDFRIINEIYGEDTGDSVLKKQALIMQEKAHVKNINARFCDDKFALFMEKDDFSEEMFQNSFQELNQETLGSIYKMSISVGIYEILNKSESVQIMYDKAKMAMDSINDSYRQMFAFYDSSLMDRLLAEKNIVSQFEHALDDFEFQTELQPITDKNGRVLGAEILVRWNQFHQQVVMPAAFISVLEKTGLIYKLDMYVWETAVKKIREWNKKGVHGKFISVNISSKDKYYIDVYETFTSLTKKYNVSPSDIALEICERDFFEDSQQSFELVKKLKKAGFKIFIDRFGAEYSSLNVLKDFEADAVKIDTSFLGEDQLSKKNKIVLETTIKMAELLDMQVIAQCVETKAHIQILEKLNCKNFQGFYFSRPLPAHDFEFLHLGLK